MSFLGKKVNPRPSENYKVRVGRKSSLVEFFKSPTRYLKESLTIESAFEKPYLDQDYNKMHLDIPAPDWPTWNFSWNVPTGDGPMAEEFLNCRGCGMMGWHIRREDCAEKPVNIHASWWCSSRESKGQYWYEKGVGDIKVEAIVGEIVDVQDGRFANIFPDKDIWLNPDIDVHVISGVMTDIYGTPCSFVLKQECETCACPSGTFAFDDGSTSDTIDPGGSISAFVTGGCPPYSWSTSSLGASLGSAQTSNGENTVISANGACGADYAAIFVVTVTDNCGDGVVFYLRNTGGSTWDTIDYCQSCASPPCVNWDKLETSYDSPGCRWESYDDFGGDGNQGSCTKGPGVVCPEATHVPPAGTYTTYYEEWIC